MKTHTTIKGIKKYYSKVFQCGYCDLQYIFTYIEPQYYNSGVYGWNCDIYTNYYDIAITTGYRNMAGRLIPSELIEKYSNIAKDILKANLSYQDTKVKLDNNRDDFFEELRKLA